MITVPRTMLCKDVFASRQVQQTDLFNATFKQFDHLRKTLMLLWMLQQVNIWLYNATTDVHVDNTIEKTEKRA